MPCLGAIVGFLIINSLAANGISNHQKAEHNQGS